MAGSSVEVGAEGPIRESGSAGNDGRTSGDVEADSGDMADAKSKAKNSIGERPACFKTTVHEISFVFMATIAMAASPFLTGATVIVTASIGKDLGMSQSQITWISASAT